MKEPDDRSRRCFLKASSMLGLAVAFRPATVGEAFADSQSNTAQKEGSEQEFDGTRILSCFPENHEFGFGGGHALGFEQQIAQVFIPSAAA